MKNLEVMVILFIIVILGYVACKLGYMGDKFDKKLSSMVVDITCPLLVLSSVMGDELPDRTLILPLLGVGFLTYILLLVFGFWVPRLITRNHDDQGMIGFALMFANVGFIGSSMAKLPVKEIIGSPKVYLSSFLRLAVVPLSIYFLFKLCGVSDQVNDINTVVIAMPVASFGTMFCLKYGRNPSLITEMTFITTVGSIITIPLITLLFS